MSLCGQLVAFSSFFSSQLTIPALINENQIKFFAPVSVRKWRMVIIVCEHNCFESFSDWIKQGLVAVYIPSLTHTCLKCTLVWVIMSFSHHYVPPSWLSVHPFIPPDSLHITLSLCFRLRSKVKPRAGATTSSFWHVLKWPLSFMHRIITKEDGESFLRSLHKGF